MQLGYLADIKESFADGISLLAVSSEFKRKIKVVYALNLKQRVYLLLSPINVSR